MPSGPWLWASAGLLEAGALGLALSLMLGGRTAGVWGAAAAAGVAAFFGWLWWMRRHRRKAPPALIRPDLGMAHALTALAYLALATLLGLGLILSPPGDWKTDAVPAYGVLALVGFLSQMIVGMEARLLPMYAWLQAYAGSGYRTLPPSPHAMPRRGLQRIVLALIGVPALALTLYGADPRLVSITAWGMLVAVVIETAHSVLVVRYAFVGTGRDSGAA